jgi:hypothetical protein
MRTMSFVICVTYGISDAYDTVNPQFYAFEGTPKVNVKLRKV